MLKLRVSDEVGPPDFPVGGAVRREQAVIAAAQIENPCGAGEMSPDLTLMTLAGILIVRKKASEKGIHETASPCTSGGRAWLAAEGPSLRWAYTRGAEKHKRTWLLPGSANDGV
jgi:hypothetical protein